MYVPRFFAVGDQDYQSIKFTTFGLGVYLNPKHQNLVTSEGHRLAEARSSSRIREPMIHR